MCIPSLKFSDRGKFSQSLQLKGNFYSRNLDLQSCFSYQNFLNIKTLLNRGRSVSLEKFILLCFTPLLYSQTSYKFKTLSPHLRKINY